MKIQELLKQQSNLQGHIEKLESAKQRAESEKLTSTRVDDRYCEIKGEYLIEAIDKQIELVSEKIKPINKKLEAIECMLEASE